MRWWTLTSRLRELLGLPPVPPPGSDVAVPSAPRVEVGLGRAVPGAVVRLVPAALVVLCGGLAGGRGMGWWVTVTAALLVAVRPGWPVAPGFLVMVALWVLADGDRLTVGDDGMQVWRVGALMAGAHLMLSTAALTAHVAWRSLVEAVVLLRVARGVLAAQALAVSLLLLVAWVRAGVPGEQPWLRLVVVAAVGAVTLLAVPRAWLRRRPDPAD